MKVSNDSSFDVLLYMMLIWFIIILVAYVTNTY